jgi:hypothetical protein
MMWLNFALNGKKTNFASNQPRSREEREDSREEKTIGLACILLALRRRS